MDPRILELQYRVGHQHDDGSWGALVEERSPDDPAAHDPERLWPLRRIFRCPACGEVVALSPHSDTAPPDAE